MNEKNIHEIVLDLLPSYIDQLTHESTTQFVKDHLNECPSCREVYRNMVSENEIAAANIGQVNFLKTMKRKTKRNVILAIVLTALLIAGVCGLKIYVFGQFVEPQYLNAYVSNTNGNIVVGGQDTKEDEGIGRIRWQKSGKILKATVYATPSGTADFRYTYEQEGIEQIWLNGLVEWDDGTQIKASIARIYNLRAENGQDQKKVEELIRYGSGIEQCETSFEDGKLRVDIQQFDPSAKIDKNGLTYWLSVRVLGLIKNVRSVVWLDQGKEIASYEATDFSDIKEAFDHPSVLQKILEKQNGMSQNMLTIGLDYDTSAAAPLTTFTLYENGKRVYETAWTPASMIGKMSIDLPKGEYEAQMKIKENGTILASDRILIKYDQEHEHIDLIIKYDGKQLEIKEK